MPTKQMNRFYLVTLIYFLVVSFLFYYLPLPIPRWISVFIMQCLIYVPILLLYLFLSKQPVTTSFSLHKLEVKDGIICTAIGFFVQPFMSMIVLLTSFIQPNLVQESIKNESTAGLIPLLLISAVQPAVFEELLFRGAFFSGYRRRGVHSAILISAFLFGLFHMNLQQALYAFGLGIIFAIFVSRTGSILSTILPHFLINAYNSVLSYFATEPNTVTTNQVETITFEEQFLSVGIQCLICIPILCILFYLFFRRHPIHPVTKQEPLEHKDFFWTISICLSVLIFVGLGVIPTLKWFIS